MKYYIACFFVLSLIAFGCKKKPVSRVDADLKAAFSYQPGTYWTYKDSLTGAVDSFVIKTNDDNFSTNDDGTIETIGMYMAEYTVSSSYLDTSLWQFNLVGQEISLTWDQTKSIPRINQIIHYNPLTFYPFKNGLLPGSYFVGLVTNIDPLYTVDTKTYNNVEEINDTLRQDAWST